MLEAPGGSKQVTSPAPEVPLLELVGPGLWCQSVNNDNPEARVGRLLGQGRPRGERVEGVAQEQLGPGLRWPCKGPWVPHKGFGSPAVGGGQWGLEGSEVHPSLGFRKGTGVALRGAGGLPIWASLG